MLFPDTPQEGADLTGSPPMAHAQWGTEKLPLCLDFKIKGSHMAHIK